ncbi:MAG: DUF4783 domain-containing protein [Bacteroidia bacterium]|nr:DUF4783 domain-containing protein [Bacteroidia bacterium]MDW8302834.1 DUF4783 domain-containing protein [Bacteroidia bacterium]
MKIIHYTLFLVFWGLCIGTKISYAQEDTFRQIETAIQNADANTIAQMIKGTADITIGEEEGTYTNTQAAFILKSFFEKNPPKAARLIHRGTSNNMIYAIGNYTTTNNLTMRLYILLKQDSGKYYIQELRLENNS